MALPFVLAAILPAIVQAHEQFGRLADSLGITGSARLIRVTLPRVRKTLGFGAGLSAALAMGDLGVVTLFGTGDATTLPLEMYRLMGAYRLDQASGAALLLLAISLTLFWIFDMIGRRNA
jgi:thiamine transport system permease protein